MKKGMFAILMAVLVLSVGLMGCAEPEEETTGTLKITNQVGMNETIEKVYLYATATAVSPSSKDENANIANGSSKSYTVEPGSYFLGVVTDTLTTSTRVGIQITKGKTTSVTWETTGLEGEVTKLGPAVVPVTSVTLNKTSTSLVVGGTETLTATVSPSTATDKTVTWSSSASSVAIVNSSTGVVTAVAVGSATITATAGVNKTATCAVTVTAAKGTLKVLNDLSSGGLAENITSIKIGSNAADTTMNLSSGQYKEYQLDPGTYDVTIKTNLETEKSISVQITAGQTKTVALVLTGLEGRALGGSRLRLIELD